jgi:hypothetical protein
LRSKSRKKKIDYRRKNAENRSWELGVGRWRIEEWKVNLTIL